MPILQYLSCSTQGLAPSDLGNLLLFIFIVPGNSSFSRALFQSQEDTEAHLIPGFDPGNQGEEIRV